MRILLTGANGFTGKHFISHALLKGHCIYALDADLTIPDQVKSEVLRIMPDAVVHLAAISDVEHEDISSFYDVNVIGTLNLLDAILQLQILPQRILISSSANIYGNTYSSPINENQVPAPVNHYGASKVAMEYMAKTYLDKLPIFFTRPFNYIGPHQSDSLVVPKIVAHFIRRSLSIELGNLNVEREFNDVRFVCESYLALLEGADVGDVFNICSGRLVSLLKVVELLTEITGHKITINSNDKYIRKNEIKKLCGDPGKLNNFLSTHGYNVNLPSLECTLNSMLMLKSHTLENIVLCA